MQYAGWANNEKMKKKLVKVNRKEKLEKSGLPLMYDESNLYINYKDGHNLIVGATGSGKTQSVILPMARLSIKAGESFVVNDIKGEIYEKVSGMLKDEDYNAIILDFNEAIKGNNWNPFTMSYNLYKLKKYDTSMKELENIAYYLFSDPKVPNDFWVNTSIDYFVGLALYLYENANEKEITLESVYALGNYVDKDPTKFLNSLKPNSMAYYNLLGTLKSPIETRGGIIATFNKGLKKYVSRVNLSNMLSSSDFDLNSILDKKTAIFILSGNNSDYDNIIPLFINQLINSIDNKNKKRFNILLDEFDSLLPIKDFSKLINYSRSVYVCLTAIIRSFKDLENIYGKEDAEIVKMCFGNIIYLLSNDYETLEEISRMCGSTLVKDKKQPLITVEELKTMDYFEAIALMIRELPIKTKLLPDYKIDWEVKSDKQDMPIRKVNDIELFDVNKVYD